MLKSGYSPVVGKEPVVDSGSARGGHSLPKAILTNTLFNYMGQLAMVPVTFALSVYMIRGLDVGQYGVFRLLTSTGSFVLLLSYFGLPNAVQRYVPELYALGETDTIRAVLWYASGIRLAATLGFVVVASAVLRRLAPVLQAPELTSLLPLYGLTLLARATADILETGLRALLLEGYRNAAKFGTLLLKLAGVWVALRRGQGIVGVLIVFALGEWIFVVLCLFRILQEIPRGASAPRKERRRAQLWTRAMKYAGLSYLSQVGTLASGGSFDVYVVGVFLGAAGVGLYSFAFDVSSRLLSFLPVTAFIPVMTSAALRRYSVGQSEEYLDFVHSFSHKLNLLITAPAVVISCLFGREIIVLLFDEKYLPALTAFVVLVVSGGLRSFAYPLRTVIVALEQPHIFLYSRLVGVFCNVTLDLLLVPLWGIMGAAVAATITPIVVYVYQYVLARRIIALKMPWKSMGLGFLNSLALAIALLLLKQRVSNLYQLLASVLLGAALYAGLCLVSLRWIFTKKELSAVRSGMPSRLAPLLPNNPAG